MAGAAADVRVLARAEPSTAVRLRVEIAAGAERATFEFNFRQAHNVVNALAAIGAAHALGVPLYSLARGRATGAVLEPRGEELELPDGVVVINDCYNANPMSMRAALDHLAAVADRARRRARGCGAGRDGASWGPTRRRSIARSAPMPPRPGVEVLVAVGELGERYVRGYADAGARTRRRTRRRRPRWPRELIEPGDVVLVKALALGRAGAGHGETLERRTGAR